MLGMNMQTIAASEKQHICMINPFIVHEDIDADFLN